MTEPAACRRPKALAFDVFGTVVDWRSSIARESARYLAQIDRADIDPHDFADQWRRRYLPAMAAVSGGQRGFVKLDVLHREMLEAVLRDLDIDLIDRINPFGEAYAILAKTMSEESLKRVAAVISAKKVNLTPEEARDLAKRALKFKQERGRLPSITSMDAWEKRMAEGVAFLARMKADAAHG